MKCLSVQLQTDKDDSHNVEEVLFLVRSLGRYPEVDVDEGGGKYVNLNFFTEEADVLWSELDKGLLHDEVLGEWIKKVSIIVCEGETSQDEYILLWHYDENIR